MDNKKIIAISFLIITLSFAYYFVLYLPSKHKAEQELLIKSQLMTSPSPSPTISPTPVPTATSIQLPKTTPNPCSKYNPKTIGKELREKYPESYPGLSDELLGDIFLKKYLDC